MVQNITFSSGLPPTPISSVFVVVFITLLPLFDILKIDMAKLLRLPELAIISGLKGKIDFYLYRASADPQIEMKPIPCARMWPRSPGRLRSPAVQEQWPAFALASQLWNQLTPYVQQSYIDLAQRSGLSARDLFTRSYLAGLYRYPTAGE